MKNENEQKNGFLIKNEVAEKRG